MFVYLLKCIPNSRNLAKTVNIICYCGILIGCGWIPVLVCEGLCVIVIRIDGLSFCKRGVVWTK